MEKLELKHLAPYLPYNINVQWLRTEDSSFQISEFNFSDACWLYNRAEFKPILRPLSEIKNFEDIMDEFSEYSWEMFENAFFVLGRTLNCFDSITYTIAELCFKHHIDIFGLIDKGLAISYSDVQSTSNEG